MSMRRTKSAAPLPPGRNGLTAPLGALPDDAKRFYNSLEKLSGLLAFQSAPIFELEHEVIVSARNLEGSINPHRLAWNDFHDRPFPLRRPVPLSVAAGLEWLRRVFVRVMEKWGWQSTVGRNGRLNRLLPMVGKPGIDLRPAEPYVVTADELTELKNAIDLLDEGLAVLASEPGGPHAKRGRPRDTDAEKDARIDAAWQTRSYKSYEELAREFDMKKADVKRALDRVRHRTRSERSRQAK